MTGPQNAEPIAADGDHGANAAKDVTAAKGANASKATTSAKGKAPGAAKPAATPSGLAPAEIVMKLLSGDPTIDRLELPAPVQTLLVAVELERQRDTLFDADGIYTGESFNGEIRKILPGITKSRLNTVIKYLRRVATESVERDGKSAIKFKGTSEADSIVLAHENRGTEPVTEHTKPAPGSDAPVMGDATKLKLLGAIPSTMPVIGQPHVITFAGHALPTPMSGAESHADTIVAMVMQAAGYNLAVASMVAERLIAIRDQAVTTL